MSLLESRLLKSNTTDTEHLLLAILRDSTSIASQALNACQVTYQNVSDYIKRGSAVSEEPENRQTDATPTMGADFADDEDEEAENGGPFSRKKENKTSTVSTKEERQQHARYSIISVLI